MPEPQNRDQKTTAWLETGDGSRIDPTSPFTFGRSKSCSLSLDNRKASREHALLQNDSGGAKWWFSDLGSTNGTYVNGRKIIQPVVLKDGDQLRIGTDQWTFRQESPLCDDDQTEFTLGATIDVVEQLDAWLLLADVKGSTKLVNELQTRVLAPRLKNWAVECEQIVTDHGGFVNEYMGDGLLAIWPASETENLQILAALERFKAAQSAAELRYRIFVHKGTIQIGGVVSSGRESVTGKEVNFIFKSEKIVGQIAEYDLFVSEPAADSLSELAKLTPVGKFEIPGFEGDFSFYSLPNP